MTPAWDDLIGAVEAAIGEPATIDSLRTLVAAAIADGTVDAELDPAQTARLLAAFADGTARLDPTEADVATALMAVTRWLHPPRMGTAYP